MPANTSYENRRTTKIRVGSGILHTIYVTIPPGSASLVHSQLSKESYFILPRNEDKDISGEMQAVEFKEWFERRAADNTLSLITWNEDTVYDHKVTFLIGVLPLKVMEKEEAIIKDLRLFLRLFRRRT